uniref:Uncharacterized protein n=1 Tax=Arundo donax TaxID=35708 RepID=A0A0A9EJI7_ARUDO
MKSSTLAPQLLWSRIRKYSAPSPKEVATSAWFTALCATTSTDLPSCAKILSQQLCARSHSSRTG